MVYSLKHRVVSWVSKTLFDRITYTVRNGLNKGLTRRGGLGWLPFEQSNPEIEFWRSRDFRGKVVYDIGAFHGLLTIYFARSAKHVVAWEPSSHNRQRLLQNVALNHFQNVTVQPHGLASKPAKMELRFDPTAPGTASADGTIGTGTVTETVEIQRLDDVPGLPPPDFVKIDTEGYELEVLAGAKCMLAAGPELFLEMHGKDQEDKRRRVAEIVEFLQSHGYTNIFHVETGTKIDSGNSAIAAEGHLNALSHIGSLPKPT